jgi:hypothetical protein
MQTGSLVSEDARFRLANICGRGNWRIKVARNTDNTLHVTRYYSGNTGVQRRECELRRLEAGTLIFRSDAGEVDLATLPEFDILLKRLPEGAR